MKLRLSLSLLVAASTASPSIGNAAPGTSTSIAQAQAAFSTGAPVHHVLLTGNALWHAGALDDSGPVTLEASASGKWSMTLELNATGTRTEGQTDFDSAMSCSWSSQKNGLSTTSPDNCRKALLWFLPDLSFQPTVLPKPLGMTDLGNSTVDGSSYKHLQGQLVFTDMPSTFAKRVLPDTTTDLFLDASYLPASLKYIVHPDDGRNLADLPLEVRFSDYREVNGAKIPFSLQRYFNGTLQLEITISRAAVN